MESAKNKKLLSNELPVFDEVVPGKGEFSPTRPSAEATRGFLFSNEFLLSLVRSDASLSSHFDELVQREASRKAREEFEPERKRIEEEARVKGFRTGLEEGMKLIEGAKEQMDTAAQVVCSDAKQLFDKYAEKWAQALVCLLDQFRVCPVDGMAQDISRYVSERLSDLEASGVVKISVSPEEFQKLTQVVPEVKEKQWEIEPCPSLREREIRCDWGRGGFLFSEERELEKLQALVRQHFIERSGK